MPDPNTVDRPWWCATCSSWRFTMPCGRDDCPTPSDPLLASLARLPQEPAPSSVAGNRLEPIVAEDFYSLQPIGGPIRLTTTQEQAVKEWAADDRLWTTQDTVEFNLRTFARTVLKEALLGRVPVALPPPAQEK